MLSTKIIQTSKGVAGWDLAAASYDSVSFSFAGQESQARGVFFKPDGTKMYIIGDTGNAVYQYSLSSAWNLSTAAYDSVSFSVAGQTTTPVDVTFKPDGTKMYVVGDAGNAAYQYSLSSAWDLSTASYDSISVSVAGQTTSPNGIAFKPDGTKMYIFGDVTTGVYQYSLSSAWNLSTAAYDSVSFSTSGEDNLSRGVTFKPDGTKMYTVGDGNNSVYQYSLSSAWNLSTAAYDSVSFSVTAEDTSPAGLFFRPSGIKLYVIRSGSVIDQYSVP